MTHESSINFSGDPRNAMQLAIQALGAAGMHIDSKTDTTIQFTGPGLNSTNEDPLRGISKARLTITGSTISINAELGAVQRLFRIMLIMIAALDLAACIVLFVVLRGRFSLPVLLAIAVGPVAPWIILLPWMSGWMKRRTSKAIDTLLNNLSIAAQPEGQRSLPQKSSVS